MREKSCKVAVDEIRDVPNNSDFFIFFISGESGALHISGEFISRLLSSWILLKYGTRARTKLHMVLYIYLLLV